MVSFSRIVLYFQPQPQWYLVKIRALRGYDYNGRKIWQTSLDYWFTSRPVKMHTIDPKTTVLSGCNSGINLSIKIRTLEPELIFNIPVSRGLKSKAHRTTKHTGCGSPKVGKNGGWLCIEKRRYGAGLFLLFFIRNISVSVTIYTHSAAFDSDTNGKMVPFREKLEVRFSRLASSIIFFRTKIKARLQTRSKIPGCWKQYSLPY